MLAASPCGEILPYPTVVSVCALKKKQARKRATLVDWSSSLQLVRTQREIDQCKDAVHDQVAAGDNREEAGPVHINELEIDVIVAPVTALAEHVETAVAIDHAAKFAGVLLGETGIESGLPHTLHSASHPRTSSAGSLFRSTGWLRSS